MSNGDIYPSTGSFAAAEPAPPDTVYTHVERTVHALCDAIEGEVRDRKTEASAARVANLAAAVRDLSAWPQFNPMNAHADYQKLAEYEVGKAFAAKREQLVDVADELEKRLHAAVQR